MTPRWWRIAVLLAREGEPWTMTLHVRAAQEKRALELVAERLGGESHRVYACVGSPPLLRAAKEEMVAAEFGPYRRSWSEPEVAALERPDRAASAGGDPADGD